LIDDTRAKLVELLATDEHDEELSAYAAELQRPVTFEHALLGALTLDRGLDCWETRIVWNGSMVGLVINVPDEADARVVADGTQELLRESAAWDVRIRERAAVDLLELANDWGEESGAVVTPAEFTSRLTLEEITLEWDGAFSFWFDDGDLFLGHS